YRTAGRGMTGPEPGRSQAPFWVTSEAEVRKDVDEMAAKKVDIIKFWVDDRDHTVTKLSPELYRAGIDEAHKKGLRTIAHIFTLEHAKGVLQEGIKISLGSDGPIPWAAHEEMADMAGCGMTPAQVIVAATRNAAELMKLADAGTIAVRKSADFVVLDANPLDDITNTRRISSV